MKIKEEIKEDVPVTTTDNAGQGMKTPELPIKPKNIFKRYKDMKNNKSERKRTSRQRFSLTLNNK